MDALALPWPLPLRFDTERASKREKRVRSTVADQPRQEPRLLCAACKHIVTYLIHRTTVSSHLNEHLGEPACKRSRPVVKGPGYLELS